MPAFIHVVERPDVRIVHSTRLDGDFHPRSPLNPANRRALSSKTWTQLTEDHGIVAHEVNGPGDHDGSIGDVLLTRTNDAVLGMWVGDCVPVVLLGREWIAGAHVGWRGAHAGVLDVAIEELVRRSDPPSTAVIGAHIGACCYEFGADDLDLMERAFGSHVRTVDRQGRPALDMGALVVAELRRAVPGVRVIDIGWCTGCRGDLFFSHRIRVDEQRHVLAVWRQAA